MRRWSSCLSCCSSARMRLRIVLRRPTQPECGALLQPARDGRAVDQGRQAGRQDDAVILASLSVERGAALVERDRLQPREPVAAAGVAATD